MVDHELHTGAGTVPIQAMGDGAVVTVTPGAEPLELVEAGHRGADGSFHDGLVFGLPAALMVVGADGTIEIIDTAPLRAVIRTPVRVDSPAR